MLRHLIVKEFLQIRRNAFLPRLILLFPVVIMCVMPWVANMEVTHIAVDVVDNDRSTFSTHLTSTIAASPYFTLAHVRSTYAEALADVEQSDADLIVEIPHDTERRMQRGEQSQIRIAANAVNGTKGSMGSSYMTNVVTAAAAPSAASVLERAKTLYLHNPRLDYKVFMIPSLIAILVLLFCGFLPALNIVGEKEKGTIEAINVTPVDKWTFIVAKLVPYWIIAAVVLTVCLILSQVVYGIAPVGSVALIYLLSMLLALVFSGLGLVISNYNDTMQQAVFVMWFCVVCAILLSGLFTPVRSMPHWAYLTTYVNPMHYFIDAIRTVFVRGGGFASIAHQVFALSLSAAIMCTWAVASYRKNS